MPLRGFLPQVQQLNIITNHCSLSFLSVSLSPSRTPGENPHIIEHPMDTTVPKNDPFTFNCKAEGNPTPTIQWFKDGRELKTDAGSHRIMLPAGGLFFLKVS